MFVYTHTHTHTHTHTYIYILIGIVSKVFANVPGDRGSLWGGVISKTQMVVDASWPKSAL